MARGHSQHGHGILYRKVILTPTGSAGAAVATKSLQLPPGVLRFVKVDYTDQAATTDLVIKSLMTSGTAGTALLTVTDVATDFGPSAVGSPAVDEARGAAAATDGTAGGAFSNGGLYFDVAQADPSVGDKDIVVEVWYEPLRYERVELIAQSGADGAGAVTRQLNLGPGVLRAAHIDFQNVPATTDVVIKRDSSAGDTVFTSTSSNTDTARPTPLGSPGAVDEAGGATAATDATDGGIPFRDGLYFDVAESDAFTTGNEKIVVHLWFDQ